MMPDASVVQATPVSAQRAKFLAFPLALLGASLIAACGSSADETPTDGADTQPFSAVSGGPGGGGAATEPENYDSRRSMTNAADLIVHARTGEVREGPVAEGGPNDGDLHSALVELTPIEILAGELPEGEPLELKVLTGFDTELDIPAVLQELQDAEPEEGVYFLRDGDVFADMLRLPADNTVTRGHHTVVNSSGFVANRNGEAAMPWLAFSDEPDVAAADPIGSDLIGRPFPEALEQIRADVNWRKEHSEAAAAEREKLLAYFYRGEGTP